MGQISITIPGSKSAQASRVNPLVRHYPGRADPVISGCQLTWHRFYSAAPQAFADLADLLRLPSFSNDVPLRPRL